MKPFKADEFFGPILIVYVRPLQIFLPICDVSVCNKNEGVCPWCISSGATTTHDDEEIHIKHEQHGFVTVYD
jgi:hypothetical protein